MSLIAALERLEKRYANEHALFVLGGYTATGQANHPRAVVMAAKRDLCRELREELQADAKALPEGGGG